MNEPVSALLNYKYERPRHGFRGATDYRLGGKSYRIAAWNHPSSLANIILNWIQHTFFFGVYIVAPMGHGKTKLSQSIAHHIHTKEPRFSIRWASGYEFTHQQEFFESLPKIPTVIIFDDVSGELKQLTDKQIESNFSSLTRIRWILDPVAGKIPVVCIVVGHYSKNLEKEFRAQLGMSIFAAFGNEEMTNIDTIAPKGSDAFKTLIKFGKIYTEMFEKHQFDLHIGNGEKITYYTDKPFRACAAISKTKGRIILYSEQDVCDKCVKTEYQRLVDSQMVFDKIVAAYGNQGKLALKIYMQKHGYSLALHPTVASALDHIEQDLAPVFAWDNNQMVDIIWKDAKKAKPKQTYHKRKLNDKIVKDLAEKSILTKKPTNTIINPTEEPTNLSMELNEQFLTNA